MNAATVFGGSAIRREPGRGLRILMWIMLFLVAFSRNYLGVHTPQVLLFGMYDSSVMNQLIGYSHQEKQRLIIRSADTF